MPLRGRSPNCAKCNRECRKIIFSVDHLNPETEYFDPRNSGPPDFGFA